MNTDNQADAILKFWRDAGPKMWFSKDDAFDRAIEKQFGSLLQDAIKGKLDGWTRNHNSCLALVILLDQFSRNLFRNSKNAFAQDSKAVKIAKNAILDGYLNLLEDDIKSFLIMPLMHSENLIDQEACLELMKRHNLDKSIPSAQQHLDIVKTFGRFPHRNAVLGRETTENEQKFLDAGGFKG